MQKKKLVPDALRKHKLNVVAQQVFADHPKLIDITESLAEFITPHFPGDKSPLFEECIVCAFNALDRAKQSNHDPYSSFLAGLVTPAWQLLSKRFAVLHDNKHIAWIPMQESVAEFLGRYPGCEIAIFDEPAPGDASHHNASILLSARVMPATEANITMHELGCPVGMAA